MNIIVGTAGHIDHGKTALIKALTGTDTDRLPEEKERGITVDLGFAQLELGDLQLGFVDVPGHERFVKNMLAGASGIDMVMLVVAADEGVMPQTREHFEICRLLGTKNGLVVITKTDLADEDIVELARMDVSELTRGSFLENAAVVSVSSKTGAGIEELKKALSKESEKVQERLDHIATQLPIDRVFTMKGFGAVVTGTLASGSITVGDELILSPPGKKVRVRGVQTHGAQIEQARAGQRTAVNLGGVDHDEITRGMVLCAVNSNRPSQILDAKLEVLGSAPKPVRSRQRVRIHLGTAEILARIHVLTDSGEVVPGENGFVQIRLEAPAVGVPGQRFILRQYSPQTTIAGGVILDSHANKHKKKDYKTVARHLGAIWAAIEESDDSEMTRRIVLWKGELGISFSELVIQTGWWETILRSALDENLKSGAIVGANDVYIAADQFELLKQRILRSIEDHHSSLPLSPGVLRETLREQTAARVDLEIYRESLAQLEDAGKVLAENDIVSLQSHNRELSGVERRVKENLSDIYKNAGLAVPKLENALKSAAENESISTDQTRRIFQLLIDEKEILKISEELYVERESIEELKMKLADFAENESDNRLITVPEFKEIAGVSRKYAIPLLEYFDLERITRRAGDKRLIL